MAEKRNLALVDDEGDGDGVDDRKESERWSPGGSRKRRRRKRTRLLDRRKGPLSLSHSYPLSLSLSFPPLPERRERLEEAFSPPSCLCPTFAPLSPSVSRWATADRRSVAVTVGEVDDVVVDVGGGGVGRVPVVSREEKEEENSGNFLCIMDARKLSFSSSSLFFAMLNVRLSFAGGRDDAEEGQVAGLVGRVQTTNGVAERRKQQHVGVRSSTTP
jgi:hypothetical protein